MSVEREIKLMAPEGFTLPDMDDVAGLRGAAPVSLELNAVYYDTSDLALARVGATVRYRTGEDAAPWTVKLPGAAVGELPARRELGFEGTARAVPALVRDLVRGYVQSRRLRKVIRMHTQRTLIRLRDQGGTHRADLVDDVVSAYDGRRQVASFHEVEVEFADGAGTRKQQRAVRKALTAAGCQAEPPMPKVVRAIGERARAAPDVVVEHLGGKPTIEDLIRHALAVSVDRLQRHDAGVRLGEDPEDLHQFRVAARTLRSDLQTFGAVLDAEWARALRGELGWLVGEVGNVRDLDVLGERLRMHAEGLPSEDDTGRDALFDHLREQTRTAREAALTALRSHRYDSLLEALIEATKTPAFAGDNDAQAALPARRIVHAAVRRQYRRLERAVAACSEDPTDADLHRIRIAAKRGRYAMEAARPEFGRPATAHAAALAQLQDVLGDWHDATVAQQWLREAAQARPTCAVVAGQLIATQRQQATRLRREWRPIWKAADAKEHRAWL
jgi:CHAD domain-containing protein